jgi:hypothetical protein
MRHPDVSVTYTAPHPGFGCLVDWLGRAVEGRAATVVEPAEHTCRRAKHATDTAVTAGNGTLPSDRLAVRLETGVARVDRDCNPLAGPLTPLSGRG